MIYLWKNRIRFGGKKTELSNRKKEIELSGGKMVISVVVAALIIFYVFGEDDEIWKKKPNERVLEINNSDGLCVWNGVCIIVGEPYREKKIEGNRIVFEKFRPEGGRVCYALLTLILSAVIYAGWTLPSYEKMED